MTAPLRAIHLAAFLALASAHLGAIHLDPAFGGGSGVVTGPIADGDPVMAVTPDHRILLAGRSDGSLVLMRRRPDGLLDAGFGVGGIAPAVTPSGFLNPLSMLVQPDGRILLLASGSPGSFLLRYLDDGSPDTSFGLGGAVAVDFGGPGSAPSLLILDEGRIVVAGGAGQPSDFAAARYDPSGNLDPSFGVGGIVHADLGGGLEFARAVARLADGRYVLAGYSDAPGGTGPALAGLRADGSIDTEFGENGKVLLEVADFAELRAVAVQSSGRIVVSGVAGAPNEAFTVGLLPDGSPDPAFGKAGILLQPDGVEPTVMALDSLDRIILAGSYNRDFAFARLLPNGSPDPTVGPPATTATGLGLGGFSPNYQAFPSALVIRSDNAIILGGWSSAVSVTYFALAQYADDTAAIPTLSEFAHVVLAVLLGLTGLAALKRVV